MRYCKTIKNCSLFNLFPEACAIKYAMIHGAITYGDAKRKTQPLLDRLNDKGELIAKKYGRKHAKIRFADL